MYGVLIWFGQARRADGDGGGATRRPEAALIPEAPLAVKHQQLRRLGPQEDGHLGEKGRAFFICGQYRFDQAFVSRRRFLCDLAKPHTPLQLDGATV